jgi:ATP synthase F0 subunit b
MFAGLITNIFALAEGGTAPWWNIPSFEVWRWVNLIIFVGLFIYILRRPVSEAMRSRREGIRRDLMRAQEERNAALAKLEEVEARLARLDAEVTSIHEQSQKEAAAERERIRRSTEDETQKLREQARREIESAGKAARQELREFAAAQSVRLAEEMIRRDIKPEDDAHLVNLRVEELGGVKR